MSSGNKLYGGGKTEINHVPEKAEALGVFSEK